MRRIYHLSTCDTCRKILNKMNTDGIELIDIKTSHISEADLDTMKNRVGSYEALLNKRAKKLKELPMNKKPANDDDFKKLILSEYTFLKRPAMIIDEKVFVGNDKQTIEAVIKIFPK